MTTEVSSVEVTSLQNQNNTQTPIIKEWVTITQPLTSKNGKPTTPNANNESNSNHASVSTTVAGIPGHVVVGTGSEGSPTSVLSNDRRLFDDDNSAKSGISNTNCQGETRSRNRSDRNENMGGNLEANRSRGTHEHDQLAGVGCTNGTNISLTSILPILPVSTHQSASPICPDGIAEHDNKPGRNHGK